MDMVMKHKHVMRYKHVVEAEIGMCDLIVFVCVCTRVCVCVCVLTYICKEM